MYQTWEEETFGEYFEEILDILKSENIIQDYHLTEELLSTNGDFFLFKPFTKINPLIDKVVSFEHIYYLISQFLIIGINNQEEAEKIKIKDLMNGIRIKFSGNDNQPILYYTVPGVKIKVIQFTSFMETKFYEQWAQNYTYKRLTDQEIQEIQGNLSQNFTKYKQFWEKLQEDSMSLEDNQKISDQSQHQQHIKIMKTEMIPDTEKIQSIQVNQFGKIVLQANGNVQFQLFHNHFQYKYVQKYDFLQEFHASQESLFQYKGQLNNEYQPDGKGGILLKFKDAIVYKGDFKNGVFYGTGFEVIGDENYEGNFVNNYRHGKGVLKQGNLRFEGKFKSDRKHGQFTVQENSKISQCYFQNDSKVSQAPDESISVPFAHLYESGKYRLRSDHLLQLDERQWLKSGVLDYYLGQVYLYFKKERYDIKAIKKLSRDQMNKKLLVPLSDFLDIFGCQLKPQTINVSEENKKQIRNLINYDSKKKQITLNDFDQILMPLNFNRQHFLLLVLEPKTKKLFQIDSIKENNLEFLLEPMQNLFDLKETSKNILVSFLIEFVKLNVAQQPNEYDCGVYTAYNTQQIMKNHYKDITIEKLYNKGTFNFEHNNIIDRFRKHMRNVIEDNFEKLS